MDEALDWDEMNAPMAVDYKKDGKTVKGLLKPSRNGYLYWLSRSANGIEFVAATNYVKQDVFKSIDPKTGRVYIPANENHCGYMEGYVQEYVPGKWWTGVDIPNIGFVVDKNVKYRGDLQAWDVSAGKQVWSHKHAQSMHWGPVLTTAASLVFSGGTNDRKFRAHDAKNGNVLWEITTNSGITAPPSSFTVDGKQYIAVVSGWGVDPAFQQGLINNLLGLAFSR